MMATVAAMSASWNSEDYAILPGFLDADACRHYRAICDRIYEQWCQAHPPGYTTNIAFLTDEAYFQRDKSGVTDLLNLIGGRAVIALLETLVGAPVRFHNTQYFTEQRSGASPYLGAGNWHRDTQFEAPDLALEQRRLAGTQSAHFRIAFEDDDCLEIVPGSAGRWDTPEELAIRRPPDTDVWARTPQTTSDTMPGARRLALKAGDAVIFHAWSIHRGHYATTPVRRSLDVIYAWGPIADWAIPTPSCFQNHGILQKLHPDARQYFDGFVAAYAGHWAAAPGT